LAVGASWAATSTTSEVRSILEALQFTVAEPKPGIYHVTVPSWRATKDISIKDDLVEEVGRMLGYISITPTPPAVPRRRRQRTPSANFLVSSAVSRPGRVSMKRTTTPS
jgi:phenylalanyl-tRNA synthetase beta subunit